MADGEPLAIAGSVWMEILLGFRSDAEADRISGLLEAFDFDKEPTHADCITGFVAHRAIEEKALAA
jgi:hypothetical protein